MGALLRRLQDAVYTTIEPDAPTPAIADGHAPAPAGGARSAPPDGRGPGPVDGRGPELARADLRPHPPEPAGRDTFPDPADPFRARSGDQTSPGASSIADTAAIPAVGYQGAAAPPGIDPVAFATGFSDPDVILGRRRRRRPGRVRSRATVRHLDIMSVIRVSLLFWLVIVASLIVASILLWLFADAFGTLPSIEKSVRTLFSLRSFKIRPGAVAMYTAAAGAVLAVAGLLGTVVFALIYNLIADVVGGVRVELESYSTD